MSKIERPIVRFRDEYSFLSNFFDVPVIYNSALYKSSEAAFQAQKAKDPKDQEQFRTLDPGEAKHLGRRIPLRYDWDVVKLRIMQEIVAAKFRQNPTLKLKLMETGEAYLEEGNNWGDRFWGTVNGEGSNHLGHILMDLREVFAEEAKIGPELFVMKRSGPGRTYYGGYTLRNGQYEQVFNTEAANLFMCLQLNMPPGCRITCLDEIHNDFFMTGRLTMENYLEN